MVLVGVLMRMRSVRGGQLLSRHLLETDRLGVSYIVSVILHVSHTCVDVDFLFSLFIICAYNSGVFLHPT